MRSYYLATAVAAMAATSSTAKFTASRNRAVLYVEGMFDNSYSHDQMIADAREVAASGFEVAILAFLHYNPSRCPNGAVYNNICFSAASALPEVMQILRADNSSIQQVLVSIGGAGCENDFTQIGANWAQFQKDLPALVSTYGLDGFDIDIEVGLGGYMSTLVEMVNFGASLNYTVTACPAPGLTSTSDWAKLVSETKSARYDGSSGISYLMLQTYGGGEAQWVKTYSDAMSGLVPNTALFIGPGGEVGGGFGPSDAAKMVTNSKKVLPGIITGMVWDYRSIKLGFNPACTNATQYGVAINKALSNNARAAADDEEEADSASAARALRGVTGSEPMVDGVPADVFARTVAAAKERYAARTARSSIYCKA